MADLSNVITAEREQIPAARPHNQRKEQRILFPTVSKWLVTFPAVHHSSIRPLVQERNYLGNHFNSYVVPSFNVRIHSGSASCCQFQSLPCSSSSVSLSPMFRSTDLTPEPQSRPPPQSIYSSASSLLPLSLVFGSSDSSCPYCLTAVSPQSYAKMNSKMTRFLK